MECSNVNCQITGNDRMVSCWLCVGCYHLKCSGLKARDADSLADTQKSLHWTCPNCKNISVEFYNLFKSSKDEFDKINKEFLLLQTKLIKYGELFTKYSNLEKFTSSANILSPKRKKTNSGSVPPYITCSKAAGSTSSSDVDTNFPPGNTNLNINPSFPVEENVITSEIYPRSPLESTTMNMMDINTGTTFIPVTSAIQPVVIHPAQNSTNIHPLRVIPPKKTIFISRFAFDTSIDDIEYYIKTKLNLDVEMVIYKFKYSQPRTIASFKIMVPPEIFDHLIDPRFWPDNALIREYVYRDNQRSANTVHLPSRSTNFSKN
ncbi:uncharacterized protein LOC135961166 [Calliphora vicina]|uniref:uncharacterized protein LOC135961166 n=1 Tax=Calliphora vicina TaxID=7373 RepID=UPI00325AA4E4